MTNIIPVLGVVYKSKDGGWRGFCYPYDVTCNASNRKEVMEKLEALISAYEESLERHNNPKHLIDKKLSDIEDRKVLKKIWPEVSKKIAKLLRQASSPTRYSDCLSGSRKITINSSQGRVSYSHRSLCMTA